MINGENLLERILPVVRRAGQSVRTAIPQTVNEKSGHTDLVTECDVQTQRFLTEQLSLIDPEAHFVGEEEHLSADTEHGDCFIIDPIDGTTNFVKGYRHSAVSVGLLRDGKPLVGVIYNPFADEMFAAVAGHGATCNGRPVHAAQTGLRDSVICFGTSVYYPDLAQRSLRVAAEVLTAAIDLRRLGSAALDLCDAACGRCGAFYELRLSPWDYAAGGLIATEAGGSITDENGQPLTFGEPHGVVAGGPACAELLEILRRTR